MRLLFYLSVLFILVASSCKKTYPTNIINNDTTIIVHTDTTIIQDTSLGSNQIRFMLPGIGTGDTSYQYTPGYSNVQKFNVDYYPNVDSIFYTVFADVAAGNTGTVELYNFTDSVVIPGSLLNISHIQFGQFYQSGNLVSALPHKEISLGLRVKLKNTLPDNYFNAVDGYLYLYKK